MAVNFQQQTLISGVIQMVVGFVCFVLGTIEVATTRRTISSLLGTPIWTGFWIIATGIIGVLAARSRGNCCGSLRCMAAVYMGFSITSIVFACMLIITSSITLTWYSYAIDRKEFVTVSLLILIASIVELGAAIWGVVCSCATVRCCANPQAPTGQGMCMQTQGGGSVAYVIVQGSDGTTFAVPAQPGGPVVAPGGTPVISQGGAVPTAVPPHHQQQVPPQSGAPGLAVTSQSGGPMIMMAPRGTPQGGVATTLHYQTPMQQQQQQQQPQNDPAKIAL